MNLYLDTSALVKRYVEEEGAADVRSALVQAELTVTSALTLVEFHSFLVRALREGRMSRDTYDLNRQRFREDWGALVVKDLDAALLEDAAALTETYPLRALDAIHLASALSLHSSLSVSGGAASPDRDDRYLFLSADRQLAEAAGRAGLEVQRVPM